MLRSPRPFELMSWPVISHSAEGSNFSTIALEEMSSQPSRDQLFDSFDRSTAGQTTWPIQEGEIGYHPLTPDPAENLRTHGEAEFNRGLAEGRQIGQKEGEDTVRKEFGDRLKLLELHLREAIDNYKEMTVRAEFEAVSLALDVAKKIVELSVEIKPEYIIDIIKRGLKAVGAGHVQRIRVSEADYEFMQIVGLPTEISAEELGIEYVPDATLRSGCIIETNFGEIDLRLDEMWAQIRQQILGEE